MKARENLFYNWKNGEEFEDGGQSLGALTDAIFDTAVTKIKRAAGDEAEIEGIVTTAIGETMKAAWMTGFDYATRLWGDK